MGRILNFSSGPATLPEAVLLRAKDALWDLDGSGIGILEHSHRGKAFGRVLERTEAAIRDVGGIGPEYAVLFMTASATHHFTLVPQNFLGADETADYCHSGVWSGKGIAEARKYGHVHVASTSEPGKFTTTPTEAVYSSAPRYVYYTSNETIYGTQWTAPPVNAPAPLVCDASSDIFSRPLALAGHGLVFAGAQKNLGPSGISLVLARKDFIETGSRDLAALWQYRTYDHEKSIYNTPNTFGIWMIGATCEWIREQGGLGEMEARNRRKAQLLYDFLDGSKTWRACAERGSRSLMNVTFRGATAEQEARLLAASEQAGMSGLKGHRSVGGLRASIYNAFPETGVLRLVELLATYDHG